MVLKYVRNKLGPGVSLPWESIDSSDGQAATTWDGASSGDWFVESPPGRWEMEPPAGAQAAEEPLPPARVEIEEEGDQADPPGGKDGGGWTLAALCMGLSLIAGCVIIPQADANRRLVYEREKLRMDLAQIEKQKSVNTEFLSEIERDPQLTERLAQREMRAVLQGTRTLDVKSEGGSGQTAMEQMATGRMSPFSIVNVPPPPALVPYQPVGGEFAKLCRDPRGSGYVMGIGMMLVAAGLTLGGGADGAGDGEKPQDGHPVAFEI
jgi:hypothetical protein